MPASGSGPTWTFRVKDLVGCDLQRSMGYTYADYDVAPLPEPYELAVGMLLLVTPGNTGLVAFPGN
ncbi:MAG: hypothetical protein U0527_03290 [Candidatus Eisenbacteria bacterium]